ncbi:HAMP domain-containing histidine kinase [archaeon]|nr:MAG: HAMP domain-containing histidine kinase [archaeon]
MSARWGGDIRVRNGSGIVSDPKAVYLPYEAMLNRVSNILNVLGYDVLGEPRRLAGVLAAVRTRGVAFTAPLSSLANRRTLLAFVPTLCLDTSPSSPFLLDGRIVDLMSTPLSNSTSCPGSGEWAGVSGMLMTGFYPNTLLAPAANNDFPGAIAVHDITSADNPVLHSQLVGVDIASAPVRVNLSAINHRGVFAAATCTLASQSCCNVSTTAAPCVVSANESAQAFASTPDDNLRSAWVFSLTDRVWLVLLTVDPAMRDAESRALHVTLPLVLLISITVFCAVVGVLELLFVQALHTVRRHNAYAREMHAAQEAHERIVHYCADSMLNPAQQILDAVENIKQSAADVTEDSPASVIETRAGDLVRLVHDMADLSSLMRGNMRILQEPVHITTVLRQLSQVHASIHRIPIVLEVHESVPHVIISDSLRLQQLVSQGASLHSG